MTRCILERVRENSVIAYLPSQEFAVRYPLPPPRAAILSAFLLSLFGTPSLTTGEGRAVVPAIGAKPMALLAFLVLERRPHSREMLAGLLWGESPEAEARASLRQALKQLRDAVGDLVRADRAVVDLADPITCDVTDFLDAVPTLPRSRVAPATRTLPAAR